MGPPANVMLLKTAKKNQSKSGSENGAPQTYFVCFFGLRLVNQAWSTSRSALQQPTENKYEGKGKVFNGNGLRKERQQPDV